MRSLDSLSYNLIYDSYGMSGVPQSIVFSGMYSFSLSIEFRYFWRYHISILFIGRDLVLYIEGERARNPKDFEAELFFFGGFYGTFIESCLGERVRVCICVFCSCLCILF